MEPCCEASQELPVRATCLSHPHSGAREDVSTWRKKAGSILPPEGWELWNCSGMLKGDPRSVSVMTRQTFSLWEAAAASNLCNNPLSHLPNGKSICWNAQPKMAVLDAGTKVQGLLSAAGVPMDCCSVCVCSYGCYFSLRRSWF